MEENSLEEPVNRDKGLARTVLDTDLLKRKIESLKERILSCRYEPKETKEGVFYAWSDQEAIEKFDVLRRELGNLDAHFQNIAEKAEKTGLLDSARNLIRDVYQTSYLMCSHLRRQEVKINSHL